MFTAYGVCGVRLDDHHSLFGPQAYQSLSTPGMIAGLGLGMALGVGKGGQGWLCSWISGFAQPAFRAPVQQ